jgi:hypothetical protein
VKGAKRKLGGGGADIDGRVREGVVLGGRTENGDITSMYDRGEEVGHGGMMGEVGQDSQKGGGRVSIQWKGRGGYRTWWKGGRVDRTWLKRGKGT